MNKRMKKKATMTKHLTRKERIRNQRKTIHMLFEEKRQLERIIDIKNDLILSLKANKSNLKDKIEELNKSYKDTQLVAQEALHMQEVEKDRASDLLVDRNQAERNTEVYRKLYEEELLSNKYWQKLYADTVKELDTERAKPWWKKVLHG